MGTLCIGRSRRRSLVLLTLTFILNYTRLHFFTSGDDTLFQGDFWGVGTTLTTPSQVFRLHFASTGINNNQYLGVFFNGGFIWIANQNVPLLYQEHPKLVIEDNGSMKILYNNDADSILLYKSEVVDKINANALLQNNGNFVLREMNTDGSVKQILWQSFDHPNYILMPGMRIGFNKRTGKNWTLTSWIGVNTPDPGSFTLELDTINAQQLVIRWHGNLYWTSGPLVDGNFGNLITTSGSGRYNIYFTSVSNENETYVTYNSTATSPNNISFIRLLPSGQLGGDASVICSMDNPADIRGCVPQKFPICRNQDNHVSMKDHKYGNMSQEGYKEDGFDKLSLYDCGVKCLNNCSCVAYSSTTDDNTGCQLWDRDIKFYQSSTGRPIYFIQEKNSNNSSTIGGKFKAIMGKLWVGSVIGGAVVILVSSYMFFVFWRKHRIEAEERWKQRKMLRDIEGFSTPSAVNCKHTRSNKIETTTPGMHIFSFESIQLATDNFSSANKLGEGGFGPVYKGQLLEGREIAIKRLSRSSRQGLREFKNEVTLIANFQHTNLVKLHGFCVEREERMLIYEYMPNKSLDFYLFDSNNKILLDWKKRLCIIQGIAQGLVYLHTYSRLTVIHRDLKPSNILLDHEMNPKISDFGMAKIFGMKESENNTNRVVGTFGYMSPEYVLNGIVSTKIDVFSFGVILLEIVSGRKNASNYGSDYPLNLIGHAWQLWNKGKASELIDPVLKGLCDINEVLRCIHISLLCVQDQAKDRPTMLDVVSFLSSEAILLAGPKQSAFFMNTGVNDPTCYVTGQENHSLNNVTISTMCGLCLKLFESNNDPQHGFLLSTCCFDYLECEIIEPCTVRD